MAFTVYAGSNVTVSVQVKNVGSKEGTFKLTGRITYYGSPNHGAYAGAFTKRAKDYCTASKESDWDYITVVLAPGQVQVLTMYKMNIACGNNQAFDDGQQFKITWRFENTETGQYDIREDFFTYRRR